MAFRWPTLAIGRGSLVTFDLCPLTSRACPRGGRVYLMGAGKQEGFLGGGLVCLERRRYVVTPQLETPMPSCVTWHGRMALELLGLNKALTIDRVSHAYQPLSGPPNKHVATVSLRYFDTSNGTGEYVCLYVCLYVCVHEYEHVHVCVYECVYVYVCIYICMPESY